MKDFVLKQEKTVSALVTQSRGKGGQLERHWANGGLFLSPSTEVFYVSSCPLGHVGVTASGPFDCILEGNLICRAFSI